jgi:hypothetical protein
MFMELLPVLKDRMVTLMIARLDDQLLRVNVIPKRTSDQENKAAETALSTPLTIRDRGGTGPGIRAAGAQLQRLVRACGRKHPRDRDRPRGGGQSRGGRTEEYKRQKGLSRTRESCRNPNRRQLPRRPAMECWSSAAANHRQRPLQQRNRCLTPSLQGRTRKQVLLRAARSRKPCAVWRHRRPRLRIQRLLPAWLPIPWSGTGKGNLSGMSADNPAFAATAFPHAVPGTRQLFGMRGCTHQPSLNGRCVVESKSRKEPATGIYGVRVFGSNRQN